jgi:hypothetical protein
MSASGLMIEGSKGRLTIEHIANKDYTTLDAISRMRELCRLQAKEPASTGESRDTAEESSLAGLSGLSKTVADISPQDALRARLKKSHPAKLSKR